MLSTLINSLGVKFLFLTALIWIPVSPLLYGFVGPKWWRAATEEFRRYWWRRSPLRLFNPVILLITLVEISIPIGVAWFLYHHGYGY